MTKILICGSRDYADAKFMAEVLSGVWMKHGPFTCVIDGMAKGADMLGHVWAKERMLGTKRYAAEWNSYGKAAGAIRNQQMLDDGKPDLVVAFLSKPLSQSRGTYDMVTRARKAGVKVIVVGVDDTIEGTSDDGQEIIQQGR